MPLGAVGHLCSIFLKTDFHFIVNPKRNNTKAEADLDFSFTDLDFSVGDLDFTFDGFDQPPLEKKKKPTAGEVTGIQVGTVLKTKAKRRYFYDLATSALALDHIRELPGPDECLHCIMTGDYHAFDVLLAICDRAGEPIKSLTITTLGFNRHNIAHLCQMINEGRAADVQILCSYYLESVDVDLFAFARGELAQHGAKLRSARNHSKILCIEFPSRFFVVESSANLRSCNKLEQFTLTQSEDLFVFHREWIRRVIANA